MTYQLSLGIMRPESARSFKFFQRMFGHPLKEFKTNKRSLLINEGFFYSVEK